MAGARVNELRFLLISDSNVDFLSVEEGRNERKGCGYNHTWS